MRKQIAVSIRTRCQMSPQLSYLSAHSRLKKMGTVSIFDVYSSWVQSNILSAYVIMSVPSMYIGYSYIIVRRLLYIYVSSTYDHMFFLSYPTQIMFLFFKEEVSLSAVKQKFKGKITKNIDQQNIQIVWRASTPKNIHRIACCHRCLQSKNLVFHSAQKQARNIYWKKIWRHKDL